MAVLRTALTTVGVILVTLGIFIGLGAVPTGGGVGSQLISVLFGIGGGALLASARNLHFQIKQHPTTDDTLPDWLIPGIARQAHREAFDHALVADESAGHSAQLFHLKILDVGVDTPTLEGKVITYQNAPIPSHTEALSLYVTLYVVYPQRGTLEFKLFDADDNEIFYHHHVFDMQRTGAIRIVSDAYHPTTANIQNADWVMGAYFNNTLIALHPVQIEKASP
jgi:hypothetical protein